MKKLLVIGGSGFFGRSILEAFSKNLLDPWQVGQVIVMSRNAERLLDEAPHLIGQGVDLYSADITKTDFLPVADYVIHAASSTDLRDYLSKPEKEKNNIQAGTYNYCELAKKYHAKSKIVYVSSGAVYGVPPPSLSKIDENCLFDLSDMPSGKLDYAIAKRDAEAAVVDLGRSGLNVSIARCFAFVGPWLPLDQHFAIGNFISDVIAKRVIKVNATRNVYRSYMHADDLAVWLIAIADKATTNCPIYNVGSDDATLLAELAEKLAYFYGLNFEAKQIEDTDVDRYIPDISRAKKELGLELNLTSLDAIHKTINALQALK